MEQKSAGFPSAVGELEFVIIMQQKRYVWIDWMKTMGMFFIISGHFFSVGHKYLYMFSVPLFFFLSGVLFHKENDTMIFVKKCFYNLFLPMFLICSSIFVARSFLRGTFTVHSIFEFVYGICLGKYAQLETCWFVYTLILLKIIFQFVNRNIVKFFLLIIFLSYAYYLNCYVYPTSRPVPNAVVNVCLAYPFFFMGALINKSLLNKIDIFNKRPYLYALLVISVGSLLLFAHSNGVVFLFICSYGHSILLFFAGSLSGILFVFALAKLIPCQLDK